MGCGFNAIPREDITIEDLLYYHPAVLFLMDEEEGDTQGPPEDSLGCP